MKLRNLKLRGAIGIRKGLGIDEIEIDFTQFNEGLIAFTGKNGSGKTTIMENLHPYRQMVSRDGSLQSHFYLKDSYRILEFEQDGNIYTSKILIDALTGGSEAYLICNGQPINDGKLITYDQAIEIVLGSPELFFNSVFSGQKSKGFAELKPADRRKLFYELLNLNIYELYLEQAKSNLKKNEIKLAEIEGEIKAIQNDQPSLEELEKEREEALSDQEKLISKISEIDTEIEKAQNEIKELEVKIQVSEEQIKNQAEIKSRIGAIDKELGELNNKYQTQNRIHLTDIEDYEKLIERNQKLSENKLRIEEKISEKKEVQAALDKIKTARNNIQKNISNMQKDYSLKLKSLSELTNKHSELKSLKDKTGIKAENFWEKIDKLEKQVLIINDVPCTEEIGSGCQFLIDAYKTKNELPDLLTQAKELDKLCSEKEAEFIKLSDELRSQAQLIEQEYKRNNEALCNALNSIEIEVKAKENLFKSLDKDNWEKLQQEASEAENNIKIYEEKIKNKKVSISESEKYYTSSSEKLKSEHSELNKKIDPGLEDKISGFKSSLSTKQKQLINLNSSWKDADKINDAYKKIIAETDQKIEAYKNDCQKIETLNNEKRSVENEIRDWNFLCKAFDKTGIPVLKLENSGITITSIANELLSIFDNKFRIVFETTTLTKDKKKLKETFDINIVEDDGITEIANKSGGERVWIETALRLAISLVVRQQGRNILTSFADEVDGALDLNNAHLYLDMIRNAHNKSGTYNTFIITHRTELIELIPQRISLNDGYLEIVNN